MLSNVTSVQVVRYGIVGFAQNGVAYLLYLLITWFGVDPKLTVSLMYPLSAAISYFGNKKWSFEYDGRLVSSSVRFIIAHIVSFSINLLFLYYFVDLLFYPHQIIQIIAVFTCAAFLFLSFKYFVFPKPVIQNGA